MNDHTEQYKIWGQWQRSGRPKKANNSVIISLGLLSSDILLIILEVYLSVILIDVHNSQRNMHWYHIPWASETIKRETFVMSLATEQTSCGMHTKFPLPFLRQYSTLQISLNASTLVSKAMMKLKWAFGYANYWQLFLYIMVEAIVESQAFLTFDQVST